MAAEIEDVSIDPDSAQIQPEFTIETEKAGKQQLTDGRRKAPLPPGAQGSH